MFSDARREGLVLTNPFSQLRIAKGRGRKDIVPLTLAELDLLGDLALSAHGPEFGRVLRSVIRFAAFTTMRPGEIFGLDLIDVHLEGETIKVQRQLHKRRIQLPKNGQTRVLPYLPPQAARRSGSCRAGCLGHVAPLPAARSCSRNSTTNHAVGSLGLLETNPTAFEAAVSSERRAELRAASGSLDFYALRHLGATLMVEAQWRAGSMRGCWATRTAAGWLSQPMGTRATTSPGSGSGRRSPPRRRSSRMLRRDRASGGARRS